MPLKIELKPHESIIIGASLITNDGERTRFYIDGNVPILREKFIIKKYETLGFKQTDTLPTKVKMESSAPKVKETMKELENIIEYQPITPEKVDLYKELNIR